MIELAAFVHFDGRNVGVIPYQEVLKSTHEEGIKDDLFPEGWQDETEWVAAEVINEQTKEMYRVTLYIVRDFEAMPFDLNMFAGLFEHIAKDVITRYAVYDLVEYFNPNPHK